MNPISSLVGSAGLAAVGGSGLAVGGGGNLQMMMHSNSSTFDANMASSVTLACCQSLCDVLTELPLPTAVVDKSTHTRTLIAGGLNVSTRNGLLSNLSLVPQLQQSLFHAKQQLNDITFLSSATSSPSYFQQQNIVSPSNADPNQQPSQLLHELLSQGCFCNSQSPSMFNQHAAHQNIPNTNSTSNVCSNLNDLNADLQTIEPSIDKHMSDLHQNLMNDLINDDCDMSSSINNSNSNDMSHYSNQQQHPVVPSNSSQLLNNDFSQHNHYRNNSHSMNNIHDFKIEPNEAEFSSLGERVKNRQREAAQKANQATAALCSTSSASTVLPATLNSNIQINNEVPEQISSIKLESNNVEEKDEWQPPTVTKKVKSEYSNSNRKSSTTSTPLPTNSTYRRTETKPQIRSVKYCFSDFDSDSMLLNSSVDMVVRFEQIIDEILSTSCNDFNEYDDTSDNEYYENDHKRPKKRKGSKSAESNHVNGMSFDVTIDADQLKEIMILSAKLKQANRVVEIERKKIILFLTVLSNQLNIWFTRYKSKASTQNQEEDYDDDEREHFWELCCNASQSALHVMTSSSPTNDKASLISLEELIEVIVDFLSNNLSATTHVSNAPSSNSRSPKAKHTQYTHLGVSKRHVTRWTQLLQLLFEFINLRTKGSLTDTLILSITRISMCALFLLQNTAEMQFVSIEILCHVFEEYQNHRGIIIDDLLNSLSKIPTKKSHRKDSVLTQMLIRLSNAFFQPEIKSSTKNNSTNTLTLTRELLDKQCTTALKVITGFLSHFLRKCYQHSSSNDVDFRLIFESLLNDLLDSLHSPHSTSSILIVQIIIKILITFLSPNQSKSQSSSLSCRLLAIEYLSIICSKFAKFLTEKEDTVKELEKTLTTIEDSEKPTKKRNSKKDKDKDETPLVNKVWNMLVNYFNSEKLYREKMVLASIWIKETYFTENEQSCNLFLEKLNATKPDTDDSNNSVVDISTASLCIQYMQFVQLNTNTRLFEFSISHVTASLSNTTNTTQRSRAMKCLSNILTSSSIERASQLLSRSDLQNAMRSALLDPSTSVREATVDLIGRFVLQSRNQVLCQRYCDLIGERILDTGISVRKRVIKILRDFCIEFPEFEKCGEMAARIVRRINDDGEGIRRLVVDTCRDLWFTNTNPSTPIKYKVYSLLHVITTMINDNASIESMQSLLDQLIKPESMAIAQQICDCIMSDIMIEDQSNKITQLSAIQCVSMMSQCCPQLMVKHCDTLQSLMSLSCETLIEISLRMRVIQTIERILPHINNPSPQLLSRIEEDLTKNILQSSANIIQCSVKCLSILIKNHTKNTKLAVDLFNKFQQILYQYRNLLYEGHNDQQVRPKLLRAIFTCGLFAKFFSAHISEYKDQVRDTFIELIESSFDVDIKCKSIIALGFVIESEPKICLLENVMSIYIRILRNEFSNSTDVNINKKNDELFCIQVLNNFRNYLSESIESDENAAKTIEWSQESLKSMQSEEDSSSAQSQIIQKYLSSILINALNPNFSIRRVACNVIHVIHSGGHVHPLQLVPHLVAMTCDDDHQIRMRADHVLHEIERKYHGFVNMKSKEAVHLSSAFCKRLNCHGYRVYLEKSSSSQGEGQNSMTTPSTSTEICARLSTLYHVVCSNRNSRRGFIASLLRHLDTSEMMMAKSNFDQNRSNRVELEFVVENILFFPYTVYDEILYILNQLECTSSINSTHVTQLFKEIFVIEKPTPEYPQHQQMQPQQQQQQQQQQQFNQQANYMNAHNNMMNNVNMNMLPNVNFQNNFQENAIEDLEDIDLENEEHVKRYENNIHVNFDLLLSDTRNERLLNLTRSLRTIYLSTLLRTLLKEFYLLKDEKINDYSTNDAKTWEKPVHRRQVN